MNNFISEYDISDLSICDELIQFHTNSPNKTPGFVISSNSEKTAVEYSQKKSTDVLLPPGPLAVKYLDELYSFSEKYLKEYTYCAGRWQVNEAMNIQHYKPNEGFLTWHAERNGNKEPGVSRHLVFMTYLNDVTDGGETEFFYQKIKVSPKKGKTLIWPADWTHTHRGVTSHTQEKYIITGWFSYV